MRDAFDLSPEISYRLIAALKRKSIPFIVAPYEADAQLGYLSRHGFADVILTGDSDLLVYGAKIVMVKFDFSNFTGEEIRLDRIKEITKPSLLNFNHCMFVSACILSGCDYLKNIKGIGIGKAFEVIDEYGNGREAIRVLDRRGREVPDGYELEFIKAFLTFRFQKVYCPKMMKCVTVSNVDIRQQAEKEWKELKGRRDNQRCGFKAEARIKQWHEEIFDEFISGVLFMNPGMDLSFMGVDIPSETLIMIATGQIHPITHKPYVETKFCQSFNVVSMMLAPQLLSKPRSEHFPQKTSSAESIHQKYNKVQIPIRQLQKRDCIPSEHIASKKPQQVNKKPQLPKLLINKIQAILDQHFIYKSNNNDCLETNVEMTPKKIRSAQSCKNTQQLEETPEAIIWNLFSELSLKSSSPCEQHSVQRRQKLYRDIRKLVDVICDSSDESIKVEPMCERSEVLRPLLDKNQYDATPLKKSSRPSIILCPQNLRDDPFSENAKFQDKKD